MENHINLDSIDTGKLFVNAAADIGGIQVPPPTPLMGYIDLEKQDITFYTNGEERLRITADGKFIVNSIIEVDTATKADRIYHALMDVFVRGK